MNRPDPTTEPDAIRWDAADGLLPSARTPEGFVFAEAHATRPGILLYRRQDGTTARELIPEEELLKPAVLASLAGKPVTREHPTSGRVTTDNAAQVSVGSLMDEVTYDEVGGFVKVRMIVHRQDGIDYIDQGNTQVSVGRVCKMDPTPGTHPKFGAYDAVQRDIRFNHLAITRAGRAGPDVALRVDSADFAIQEPPMPTIEERFAALPDAVRTDGSDLLRLVEDAMTEIAALRKGLAKEEEKHGMTRAELDAARKDGEGWKGKFDAACGERDAMKTSMDALTAKVAEMDAAGKAKDETMATMEPKMDSAAVHASHTAWLRERAPLLGLAAMHKLDSATVDALDNPALRRAVAKAIVPDLRNDASDEYIAGLLVTATRTDAQEQWAAIGAALAPKPVTTRTDSAPDPVGADPFRAAFTATRSPTQAK